MLILPRLSMQYFIIILLSILNNSHHNNKKKSIPANPHYQYWNYYYYRYLSPVPVQVGTISQYCQATLPFFQCNATTIGGQSINLPSNKIINIKSTQRLLFCIFVWFFVFSSSFSCSFHRISHTLAVCNFFFGCVPYDGYLFVSVVVAQAVRQHLSYDHGYWFLAPMSQTLFHSNYYFIRTPLPLLYCHFFSVCVHKYVRCEIRYW